MTRIRNYLICRIRIHESIQICKLQHCYEGKTDSFFFWKRRKKYLLLNHTDGRFEKIALREERYTLEKE
jgi:hypothetical protein